MGEFRSKVLVLSGQSTANAPLIEALRGMGQVVEAASIDQAIEALRHEEATRKNIPTAEYQSVLQRETQDPVRVAYERRNRDLDPQLVWRGKDAQVWSDLVVQAPPLYIQSRRIA